MSARPFLLFLVVAALVFAALVVAAPCRAASGDRPPAAAQTRPRILDKLFKELGAAPDAKAAATIRAMIEKAWSRSGSPTGDLLMARAESLLKADRAAQAGALLDEIVKLDPDWTLGWRLRAESALMQGDSEGAMLDLDHALSIDPRNFEVMADLAHLMRAAGRDAPALELLRRAMSFDPRNEDLRREADELQRQIEGRKI
jgi:tetratricopeptide (TPR) repeat protein